MDKTQAATIALVSVLSAGAGAGIAKVADPAPTVKLERVCIEADGSAQIYVKAPGMVTKQLLVPADPKAAIMLRTGGSVMDAVPGELSAAIKNALAGAGKVVGAMK